MLKTISYSHSQIELRNLLFGTMIACAFAACSNEDDPIVGPDQPQTGENNATLTISVKNVARSLTKAAAEGTQTENEAKITNLTVALYDAETGALVASTSDIANEDAAADNDEVQFAGQKVRNYVLSHLLICLKSHWLVLQLVSLYLLYIRCQLPDLRKTIYQ